MQLSEENVSCDSPVARLYEQHAPALFAFLRQKTAAREDAEDVLAQVFIAAIEYSELDYAPVVANGLVYVANFYTGIYALEEQTGHTRWQHVLGTNAFTNDDGCSWPVVANGVVYTNCGDGTVHQSLNAYNATNGNLLWSKLSRVNPDAVNGDVIYGTNYPGLVYFVKTTNGTTTYQQTYGTLVPNKFGNPWAPEPGLTLVP